MSTLDALALALSWAGVLTALLGGAVTRSLRAGLPMTLDLWTAAGLLRLVGAPSFARIASAAAILAVRKLVLVGLERHSVSERDA